MAGFALAAGRPSLCNQRQLEAKIWSHFGHVYGSVWKRVCGQEIRGMPRMVAVQALIGNLKVWSRFERVYHRSPQPVRSDGLPNGGRNTVTCPLLDHQHRIVAEGHPVFRTRSGDQAALGWRYSVGTGAIPGMLLHPRIRGTTREVKHNMPAASLRLRIFLLVRRPDLQLPQTDNRALAQVDPAAGGQ